MQDGTTAMHTLNHHGDERQLGLLVRQRPHHGAVAGSPHFSLLHAAGTAQHSHHVPHRAEAVCICACVRARARARVCVWGGGGHQSCGHAYSHTNSDHLLTSALFCVLAIVYVLVCSQHCGPTARHVVKAAAGMSKARKCNSSRGLHSNCSPHAVHCWSRFCPLHSWQEENRCCHQVSFKEQRK